VGIDAADVARAGTVIVIGTTLPAWARHAAAVVLPIANCVEEEGTFTNLRGLVQRFFQAKAAPGVARPSYFVLGDLLTAMGEGAGYWTAGQAFDALAAAVPAYGGLSYAGLGMRGAMIAGVPASVGARA
jgi:NADH-quinone oxidoreductase subunit G